MRSDVFRCNRMHFGALGSVLALPEIFGFFRTILMIFGRFGSWGSFFFYGRFTFRGLTLIGANYWEVAPIPARKISDRRGNCSINAIDSIIDHVILKRNRTDTRRSHCIACRSHHTARPKETTALSDAATAPPDSIRSIQYSFRFD